VDQDVLERLTDVETRVQMLEMQKANLQPAVVNHCQPSVFEVQRTPRLHTAAAHKILNCWPRLGVKFDHPSIQPLQYLHDADHQDLRFIQPPRGPTTAIANFEELTLLFEGVDASLAELPVVLFYLLQTSHLFATHRWLSSEQPTWRSWHTEGINEQLLPTPCLLKCVVAFMIQADNGPTRDARDFAFQRGEDTFMIVLRSMWKLYSEPPCDQIPVLLVIAYLHVHMFSRPFHALGILRYVGTMLDLPFIPYVHSATANAKFPFVC